MFGMLFSCFFSYCRDTEKSGEVRALGIHTLLDRIAQQVVRNHLKKQLEPPFHGSSFGCRSGRSANDGVVQSQRNCFSYYFAIDLVIKLYFDTIENGLIMKALSHYYKDKWILMYVEEGKSRHHKGRKTNEAE